MQYTSEWLLKPAELQTPLSNKFVGLEGLSMCMTLGFGAAALHGACHSSQDSGTVVPELMSTLQLIVIFLRDNANGSNEGVRKFVLKR